MIKVTGVRLEHKDWQRTLKKLKDNKAVLLLPLNLVMVYLQDRKAIAIYKLKLQGVLSAVIVDETRNGWICELRADPPNFETLLIGLNAIECLLNENKLRGDIENGEDGFDPDLW